MIKVNRLIFEGAKAIKRTECGGQCVYNVPPLGGAPSVSRDQNTSIWHARAVVDKSHVLIRSILRARPLPWISGVPASFIKTTGHMTLVT